MANEYDPWEVAENATVRPSIYFGQVTLDIYAVVFQKGVRGGIPYNAQMHKPEDRRTMIKVSLTPLPSANVDFTTERDFADFDKAWAGITLPSVKTLGIGLRELHEKWVRYEMVKHGTYTKKDTGEEKDLTTPKFLALYSTLEEAEQAASAFYGNGGNGDEPTPASNGDPEREVALRFLPTVLADANGDPAKAAVIIANTPLIKDHIKPDDPEVMELLTKPF